MSNRGRREAAAARASAIRAQQDAAERRRTRLVVVGVVAAIVAVIGIGLLVQSARDTSGEKSDDVPAGVTDSYGVVVGEADAPVTVTLYADLQCPICRAYDEAVGAKLDEAVQAGRIKVDYRLVAFLNDQSTTDYSSRALNAAAVVLDAEGADAFSEYVETLLANQPAEGSAGLSDDQLIDYAVQAGADERAVRPGIEDRIMGQWVVNATDQMSKNEVNGTPTVFVDGTLVEGQTLGDLVDGTLKAIE
jgi:protein-disulfide isomerase